MSRSIPDDRQFDMKRVYDILVHIQVMVSLVCDVQIPFDTNSLARINVLIFIGVVFSERRI